MCGGGRARVLVSRMWWKGNVSLWASCKHPLRDPLHPLPCADSRYTQSPKTGVSKLYLPLPVTANKVLLKHSQAHSFRYCLRRFGATMAEPSQATDSYGLQTEDLYSGPLQKKFASPAVRAMEPKHGRSCVPELLHTDHRQ